MRFLLTSGSFYTLPIHRTFAIAKEAGFDGMNLMITGEFRGVDEVSLVRNLQKILPIDSIHVPFIPLWGWGNQVEKIQRTVRLAIETSVPLVNFHPPAWLLLEISFSLWFLAVRDFQQEVGKNRVMVSIENMPHLARYYGDPHLLSKTTNLLQFLQKRNLYLSFDSSHMGTKKTDFLEDFLRLHAAEKVKQVQYGDYCDGREHLKPGHGILPLKRLLQTLAKENYSEGLCVEIMPDEFPKEESLIIKNLKEILGEIKQELSSAS